MNIFDRAKNWRAHLNSFLMSRAYEKAQRQKSKIKKHWQASQLMGGTMPLGYFTKDDALKAFHKVNPYETIRYIDDDVGVIIYGDDPRPTND